MDVETLKQQHKAEMKQFQKERNAMLKGANGKKKKKIQEETKTLQKALQRKHAQEVKSCSKKDFTAADFDENFDVELLACKACDAKFADINAMGEHKDSKRHVKQLERLAREALESLEVSEGESEAKVEETKPEPPRKSKAQRRREKQEREEAELEAELKIAASNTSSARNIEIAAFSKKYAAKGLQKVQIPSDGNCMFSALAHQLKQNGEGIESRDAQSVLRIMAVDEMKANKEEFEPFFIAMPDSPSFDSHCERMLKSHEWGGNLELRALAHSLKRRIVVMSAHEPELVFGEEFDSKHDLTISFHKHEFASGQHYNSVVYMN